MNLRIISQILVDANLGVVGQTLFERHMPDGARDAIMVRLPLDGNNIDHEIPGYLKGWMQVIVRSTSQEKGEDVADKVMVALSVKTPTDYVDDRGRKMRLNYLRPRALPVVYPRTPGNTVEWSIVFDACYLLEVEF